MPIERDIIESSLITKGFTKDVSGDHRYFHHEIEGKKTGISTYTSHGSGKYKTYGDDLLRLMKKQLRLDSMRQVKDLLECPMKKNEYILILKEKRLL